MNIFNNLDLSKELIETIKSQGITEPTEIQRKSIPHIVKGKDVIGESATGSGKTLAFGCAIVEQVVHKKGLQALVLTPTRELAEQVTNSLIQLSKHQKLRIISVYGGVSINPQIHGLEYADVVVGTPGRLLDHLQRRTIDLSKIKILVLDEADRMLDMGFIKDVSQIIRVCPKRRQTLFFSATISQEIKKLADKFMNNPIKVMAKNMVDPSKLKQVYYDISRSLKLSLLIHLLKKETSGLVMVFCKTRINTDFVVNNLKANKINAIAIHGGLSQNRRTKIIGLFNDAKATILVCTDVAARGLHIDNVSHIYNYDIPEDPKDYVHRIGRTARAGEEGIVVNLLSPIDHDKFGRIQYEYRDFIIKKREKPFLERVRIIRDNNRGNFKRGFKRKFNRHSRSNRNQSGNDRRRRATKRKGSFHRRR